VKFLRTLAALAVAVCVALIAVAFAAYGASHTAAKDGARVPAEVYEPFGWQSDVASSPPGAATLIASGAGWGFRGANFKGKVAVVAESGVYRMQRYTTDVEAGEDVLLSADGEFLADGAYAARGTGDPPIWFTDLTSGKTTRMTVVGSGSARPVAWSPDGRKLLVQVAVPPRSGPWPGGELELLNLATGDVSVLADLGPKPVYRAQLAAFSPDSRLVAAQVGDSLEIINAATRAKRTLAALGTDRRIAGVGAWNADGTRVAVLTPSGCIRDCTHDELNAREWQIDELDATTGSSIIGEYERVSGLSVRVLGRLPNGEMAVARYRAYNKLTSDSSGALSVDSHEVDETDYRAVSSVTLLGLEPGGGDHQLVKLPGGVTHVDIAANALEGGRFDGKSARPMPLPAPAWIWVILLFLLVMAFSLIRSIRRRA
jgi:hypothetical protein